MNIKIVSVLAIGFKKPAMSFVSTRVSKRGSDFLAAGILTIKGISKHVSFPFQASVEDHKVVFNGNFQIDREDFDISGGIVIGKTVDVALKVKVR